VNSVVGSSRIHPQREFINGLPMDDMQMRNHHPKLLTLLVYRQRVYSIRVLSSRGCFLFLVIFLSEVTVQCIIAIFADGVFAY